MIPVKRFVFALSAALVASWLIAGIGAPALEAAPTDAVIAIGGKGTGTGRIGGALSGLVNDRSKTVRLTTRTSGGLVAITRITETGRVQFGLSSSVLLDKGQRKKGPWKKAKEPLSHLLVVGPVVTSWYHMTTFQGSGIKSFKDLVGKRVSVGPKGSNASRMSKFILSKLGIFKKIRIDYLQNRDAVTNMADEKLDAFGVPHPVPSSVVLKASRAKPVLVLDLPESVRDAFVKDSKGYFKEDRDASAYAGMKGKSFKTVAYTVYIIAHTKTSPKVVYEITKTAYDPKNSKYLTSAFKPWKVGLKAAKSSKFLKQLKSFNIKVHPGAARFWKERGLALN